MLLTRRNEALEDILRQELDRMKAAEGRGEQQQPATTAKKRGRPPGGGKGKGKAAKVRIVPTIAFQLLTDLALVLTRSFTAGKHTEGRNKSK